MRQEPVDGSGLFPLGPVAWEPEGGGAVLVSVTTVAKQIRSSLHEFRCGQDGWCESCPTLLGCWGCVSGLWGRWWVRCLGDWPGGSLCTVARWLPPPDGCRSRMMLLEKTGAAAHVGASGWFGFLTLENNTLHRPIHLFKNHPFI